MTLPRHRALALLTECRGDEIWSVEHCRGVGVPETWISELADAHESGFKTDAETIYVHQAATNQYFGIHDLDLALRLGESLGVDVGRATHSALGRRAIVQGIKDAVFDGD